MIKSFLAVFFSCSLMFTIVAPTILSALDCEYNRVLLLDPIEEEPHKKVVTSFEEDIKIIQSLLPVPEFYWVKDTNEFGFYVEDVSIHVPSINVPPPEFFI